MTVHRTDSSISKGDNILVRSASKDSIKHASDPETNSNISNDLVGTWRPQNATFKERVPTNWKDWRQWATFLEASPCEGLTTAQMFIYNEDLKPVESSRRIWKGWNFVSVWMADSINVNSWQIAGTGVEAGLTWWETWLAIWVGYLLCGLVIMLQSRVGIYAHLNFPVACRSSFGIYGSLWPVINRVVLAIIWFGSQTWILGRLVHQIIYAIFGRNVDERIGLGELSGTTVAGFVCFFIGWVIQLPAIWLKPHQVKHLFTAKAIVAPAVSIAFLIWTLVRANGAGTAISNPVDKLGSYDKAWAWIDMFMSCISNYAALILNAPDYSRFSTSPRAATWPQGITIPIAFSINSLIGLLIASASSVWTSDGKPMWDPIDVLQLFVKEKHTAADRAGVFFISAGLCLAQIGTNIMANSLSAGTDLTALVPRFINIRRGGYVCAALGLCICPWHFFASGNTFTTYLSAYSIFLSSISGVIAADYFWLRRGHVDLYNLYSNELSSPYMYNTKFGCNWRGYAAYLLALVPNMPGFAGACGRDVPYGAIKLYELSYLVGFILAFVLYVIFCLISPPDNIPDPIKGRLMDPKAPWLEEYLDVDDFSEVYRFGTNPGSVEDTHATTTMRPQISHMSYRSNPLSPKPTGDAIAEIF